jgi:3'-5' exoribonuclease
MEFDATDFDLLTVAQLKQVAQATPQPYRIQAQADGIVEKQTQVGKPYFEVRLTDGTEAIIWRIFDGNSVFDQVRELPRSGAWLEICAHWIDTGKFGLEPKQPVVRRLSNDEVQQLLQGSDEARLSAAADYGEIITRITSIVDPRLRLLCELFIERHGERFRRTAAAREIHHARRGGLVEHVAQMMRTAGAICSVYPRLNQDLIIAGVLFHDCGKLWENAYADNSFTMPYSLVGELIGHIPMGMELVNKLWRDALEKPEASNWIHLEPTSDTVRLHLLHLVASHHGELAFGSPVLPKTPEAMALHYIDNIDAKLEIFRRGYSTGTVLGPGIFDRVKPLAQHLVEPLHAHVPQTPPAESSDDQAGG